MRETAPAVCLPLLDILYILKNPSYLASDGVKCHRFFVCHILWVHAQQAELGNPELSGETEGGEMILQ